MTSAAIVRLARLSEATWGGVEAHPPNNGPMMNAHTQERIIVRGLVFMPRRCARPVPGRRSCGGCHTLKDAGSTGNVGPNLDQLKPSEAIAETRSEARNASSRQTLTGEPLLKSTIEAFLKCLPEEVA